MSQFFEMSCYNSVVQHYKNNGFHVQVQNLKAGKFRYKLSPAGHPDNFSHFSITKIYKARATVQEVHSFEIHHSVAIESSLKPGLFCAPDISVIKPDSFQLLKDSRYFFSGARAYTYVYNRDLMTFCEVKNLIPFPELLFNFTGLLNEMMNDVFRGGPPKRRPLHIAPSLMLSGSGNFHAREIAKALMQRHQINVIFGLFLSPGRAYSQQHQSSIRKIGSR